MSEDIYEDEATAERKRRAYEDGLAKTPAQRDADIERREGCTGDDPAGWSHEYLIGAYRDLRADWRSMAEERPKLISRVDYLESQLRALGVEPK